MDSTSATIPSDDPSNAAWKKLKMMGAITVSPSSDTAGSQSMHY